MSKHEEKEQNVLTYKDTLNLPFTTFPIRAQSDIFDKQVLERWDTEKLHKLTYTHNQGKQRFILYDGPPYANGNIHLGHAYNKILKDIVTKSERMSGKHVPVVPLWDCHGLPIEIKVAEELKNSEQPVSPMQLKQACRSYAEKWATIQKQEFKNLGVMMAWDKSCMTMDYIYEAQTLRAFGIMLSRGYINRKQKTVPWCMHCKTVLANAEIEYEERKDPSVYVQFPFEQEFFNTTFGSRVTNSGQLLSDVLLNNKVSLLIWTTTPWTLPLNRGVLIKPGAQYQLINIGGNYVIVGANLVEKISDTIKIPAEKIADFIAEDFIGKKVNHPFIENVQIPIIADPFVSTEDGTAFVHCAPGCGPDDYEVGVKNNLEIYSPITIDGRYTQDIEPQDLAGMLVTDGQWAVLKKLDIAGNLLHKTSLRHSYPHCWRCHNGLIFRATKQWFCDLSNHSLRDRALQALETMTMVPESGRNRLSASISGRLEWCLSRQRSWGIPIPAIGCNDCLNVYITTDIVKKVAQGFEKQGIEYWDSVSIDTLVSSGQCQSCGSKNLRKESDILDVWFDSGVSHFAMLSEGVDISYPADLYLEGKDQHRGWFQSSLLTSLALHDDPCMKEILTHGFTVDEKGRKMSKSIGNVVSPDDIIKKIGLDGLRLWVASNDYDSDPIVSESLFSNVSEVYRKIRNTCRGLLLNLYDFNPEVDLVPVQEMLLIDQYALFQLNDLNRAVIQSYKDRKTTAVFHDLADYCVKEISAFYLDIVKDRLYVEKADSLYRRSAQTVCYYILDTLTKLMAPILSVTAELVSDVYQKDKKSSIHLQDFFKVDTFIDQINVEYKDIINAVDFKNMWIALREIRTAVLKSLEELRSQGLVKHSLDAAVSLCILPEYKDYSLIIRLFSLLEQRNQNLHLFLKEYFIVSQVHVAGDSHNLQQIVTGLFLQTSKAVGGKCARCWQWEDFKTFDEEKQLCQRCVYTLY